MDIEKIIVDIEGDRIDKFVSDKLYIPDINNRT